MSLNTLNQSTSWDRLSVPLSQASLLVPSSGANAVVASQLHPTPAGEGKRSDRSLAPLFARWGREERLLLALAKPCRPLPRLRNRWRSRIGAGAPSPWRWRSQSWPSSSSARADAPPSLAVVAIVAEHPSGPPTIALPSFIVYGDDV
jgi:hypothetical protein